MILLRNSVLIHVASHKVWSWLSDLPAHYRTWHPAHVTCRFERGERLEAGAVLYAEEVLHNRLHRLRLRATEVRPGRALRYRGKGFSGAFLLDPQNGSTVFTAELAFGLRLAALAPIVDAVLRTVLARRLTELQKHMHEEGVNLKRLLEAHSA
jgi:hypothetical protein